MLDLDDLSFFFESTASVPETDVPWEFAGVRFRFIRGEDEVTCWLAPGEGDLSVLWRHQGVKRLEMSLSGYFVMKIEDLQHGSRLVAVSDAGNAAPFVLQLRPYVFVALGAAPS